MIENAMLTPTIKRVFDMSTDLVPITVAKGDGIGPEIMDATLEILKAAGARINPEFVDLGLKAYEAGVPTGVTEQAWGSLNCTHVLLKAPLTTPQGGGYKSVNVTLRKSLGLYANVRPVRTFSPAVPSKHEGVDMVIVRENEEDLYAGMEYRHTLDSCQALKLLTRSGTERIIRYAFEYARSHGRKKVSCLIKDNIMKISDGMFHQIFKKVGAEYPEIEQEGIIVDIGMAKVADTPDHFDVVVTLNLYGDIVSDIASQVAGSVGLAGSFNMGKDFAMFEAVHGSAPDIAGKGIANPSGLLNGAILMLHHIGQSDVATKVENAWLATLEQGKHTGDLVACRRKGDKEVKALTTKEFTAAVIENIGKKPKKLPAANPDNYKTMSQEALELMIPTQRPRTHVGVDVFIGWVGDDPQKLGAILEDCAPGGMEFSALCSRGVMVYPCDTEIAAKGDCWVARFRATNDEISNEMSRHLLANIQQAGLDWVKVEQLYHFDGERAYSLFQGECEV